MTSILSILHLTIALLLGELSAQASIPAPDCHSVFDSLDLSLEVITSRTVIRPLRPQDTSQLAAILLRPEMRTLWLEGQEPSVDELREDLSEYDGMPSETGPSRWWAGLAIYDRKTEQVIGVFSYNYYSDSHSLAVGSAIAPELQGQGLAGEVRQAMISALQREYPLDSVFAIVREDNHRSLRSLAKSGFQKGEPVPENPHYLRYFKSLKRP